MDILNIIIALVSGVIGGNVTGALMKEKTLGAIGNTLTGLIGGVGTNYIMQALGILASMGVGTAAAASGSPEVATMDFGHIVGNIVGSGAGGAILTALVAFVKDKFAS